MLFLGCYHYRKDNEKVTTPLDLNYYREFAKSGPIRERPSFTEMSKAILELCAEVERLRGAREGYVLVPVEPSRALLQQASFDIETLSNVGVEELAVFYDTIVRLIAAPKDKPYPWFGGEVDEELVRKIVESSDKKKCLYCNGVGRVGIPGIRCKWCDGSGKGEKG